MRVLFVDTNLFLEFRRASDLPWHELDNAAPGRGPEIRLIVPSTVINEIERHKTNGNSRKAKRARDTSTALRQALISPGHVTELRSANPRVVLELPPVVRLDFSQFPNLDPLRPDHRIAAEYAEVLKAEPALAVLSDDTLSILAVRSLGFEPILIPESWRLAPENDERDDEIRRLKEEIRTYKHASPQLSITIVGSDQVAAKIINATVPLFEMSRNDVEQAVAEIRARFPMETKFQVDPPNGAQMARGSYLERWVAPLSDKIEAYKANAYPKWIRAVEKALPALASRLNALSCQVQFAVLVSNSGFANAADVRLTITAYDGITLLDSVSEWEMERRINLMRLPAPPEAPRGRFVSIVPTFGAIERLDIGSLVGNYTGLPPARDPNGFFYVDSRPQHPVNELELTCAAFPHQGEPRNLGFRIVIPDSDIGEKPRLRVRLQASNVPKPVEEYLAINAKFERGDFIQQLNGIKFED